jgi:hypothetical protein
MILKIISKGLILSPNSFFFDFFEIINFIIVTIGLVDLIFVIILFFIEDSTLIIIHIVLRCFRLLIPLKLVSIFPGIFFIKLFNY